MNNKKKHRNSFKLRNKLQHKRGKFDTHAHAHGIYVVSVLSNGLKTHHKLLL